MTISVLLNSKIMCVAVCRSVSQCDAVCVDAVTYDDIFTVELKDNVRCSVLQWCCTVLHCVALLMP